MNQTIIVVLTLVVITTLSYYAITEKIFINTEAEWSPEIVTYTPEIIHYQLDSFLVIVKSSVFKKKMDINENGDTTKIGSFQDGFVKLTKNDLTITDSNVIRLIGLKLFPVRIGKAKLCIKLPNGIDTLNLEVEKEDWGLAIYSKNK